MRVVLVFAALTLSHSAGFGQSEMPKYEVSSVKPNSDADFHYAFQIEPDGTLYAKGITLRRLMMSAYDVEGFRFVGGPRWASDMRWDVQAKPNRRATVSQIHPMIRALLEDRFQLRVHSESRNMPIYELAIGPRGSKLRAADSSIQLDIRTGNGFIRFNRATVGTFAHQLSYALARPVVDKTGIPGEFSFDLEWNPKSGEDGGPASSGLPAGTPEKPSPAPDGPSIFTAIEEQLGLHLKSGRGPGQVVVIDRAQMPSAN
jgi:bla regulator protein blaR1